MGVGNLTFVWVGWVKLDRKCRVSSVFFFRACNRMKDDLNKTQRRLLNENYIATRYEYLSRLN